MSSVSSRGKEKVSSGPSRIHPAPTPPPPPPPQKLRADSPTLTPEENEELFETGMTEHHVRVNPPEVFKGERGQLKNFLTQADLYMYWNAAQFPDDEKKVMFMISYMRGTTYS